METLLEALLEWLREGIQPGQFWLYVAGGIVITFVYDVVTMGIFTLLKIEPEPFFKIGPRWLKVGTGMVFGLILLLILFVMATMEEVIFRLPLALLVWLLGSTGWVLLAALVLSIIFGRLHGGIKYIFCQGVVGFFWCLLFLKCGGFQGDCLTGFRVVVLVHFFSNIILLGFASCQKCSIMKIGR